MPILAAKLQPADYCRTIWQANIAHGVDFKSILEPGFWAGVASKFRVGDRIEVWPEDASYLSELLVMEVQTAAIRVRVLSFVSLVDLEIPDDAQFEVAWKGPHAKWSVIRRADKAIIYRELPSRDAAVAKLTEVLRPKTEAA